MQEICKVGICLLDTGLASRTWGNISIRKDSKSFYVTPSGISYRKLSSDDMVEVDIQSGCYENKKNPSSEMHMHRLIYMNHPDVDAILHTHQPLASAISSTIPHIMEEFDFRAQQSCPDGACSQYSSKASDVRFKSQKKSHHSDNESVFPEHHSARLYGENADKGRESTIFLSGLFASHDAEENEKNIPSSGGNDGCDCDSRVNCLSQQNAGPFASAVSYDISSQSDNDFSCGFVPHLPSGSMELAEAVSKKLGSNEAILLENHGCVFIAKTSKTVEVSESSESVKSDEGSESTESTESVEMHEAVGAPEFRKNNFPPLYTALNLSLRLEERCRSLLSLRYPAEILKADLFACERHENNCTSFPAGQVMNPLIEMLIPRCRKELKSYIDDFAQLFGCSLEIDPDRGVIFSEYDIDDMPAAISIINKNALAQLIAADNDIAPPEPEKAEQMHRNYIEKYSKLDSQHCKSEMTVR